MRSLAGKIVVTYLLVILLVVGTTAFSLNRSLSDSMIAGAGGNLFVQGSMAANLAQGHLDDRAWLRVQLGSLAEQVGSRILLLDSKGTVVMDSAGPGGLEQQNLAYPEVAAALAGQSKAGLYPIPNGRWALYAAVPVAPAALGAIFLSAPGDNLQREILSVRRYLALALLAGALLATLAGLISARLVTRPVNQLTGAASRLAAGDLTTRVAVAGRDELHQLGQAFNHMAQVVQDLDQARTAFVANASHELRTPLATVMALEQSLAADPSLSHNPLAQEFLSDIDREVTRMNRLVEHLLTLSRLERAGLPEAQPVDLADLAQEVTLYYRPRALASRITLATHLPSFSFVCGNAQLLWQALANLIDNALKHTPPGGTVAVSLTGWEGRALLQVEDSGPGLPPELLPHIFDPFVRGGAARDRGSGGYGLGLALVRQVATAHGGNVSADTSPQYGGARFSIDLPLMEEEDRTYGDL